MKREAGKGYITLVGASDTEDYAAMQILSWNFSEFPQCHSSTPYIKCSQWQEISTSSQRYLYIRNIGSEPLFIRSLTKSHGKELCTESETPLNPSLYHGYWNGCSLQVYYDDSIEDLEIYNEQDDFYTKFTDSFGSLWNPYFITDGVHICVKAKDTGIEMGLCTCERCCEFFDFQITFSLFRTADCKSTYFSSCPCYETSRMSFTETLQYQNHPICTRCKYDSHCKTFNPSAICLEDSPKYTIGNPFSTSPTDYGFEDWIRDKGRVLDGKIKGNSCDCETNRVGYFDTLGGREQYRTFPISQIKESVESCLDCLAHPFKFESDCYQV